MSPDLYPRRRNADSKPVTLKQNNISFAKSARHTSITNFQHNTLGKEQRERTTFQKSQIGDHPPSKIQPSEHRDSSQIKPLYDKDFANESISSRGQVRADIKTIFKNNNQ